MTHFLGCKLTPALCFLCENDILGRERTDLGNSWTRIKSFKRQVVDSVRGESFDKLRRALSKDVIKIFN
jgi:hypothetical protein